MKQIYLLTSVFLGLSASLTGVGCQDSFTDCRNNLSCPPPEGDGDSSTGGVVGDGDGDGDGTGGGDGDTGGTGTGGGDGDGDGDGDSTGGMGGDPNNPCLLCENDEQCTPEGECVECLISDHCTSDEAPVCDMDTGACVECDAAEDCEDPALPMCESNVCVAGCGGPEDCTRFGELGACDLDAGECVQCTPETDDRTTDSDDCGTKVCNPETLECEDALTQAAKDACEPCIADAECAVDHNCVPMDFQGDPRTGGYCLRTLASGACAQNPYRSPTGMRESLSGEGAQVYCSINEALTTCEAVLDLRDDEDCTTAEDCGAPDLADGLCETVSTVGNKCTYACSGDAAECRPSGRGSSCAGDAQGTAGSYCGGM